MRLLWKKRARVRYTKSIITYFIAEIKGKVYLSFTVAREAHPHSVQDILRGLREYPGSFADTKEFASTMLSLRARPAKLRIPARFVERLEQQLVLNSL